MAGRSALVVHSGSPNDGYLGRPAARRAHLPHAFSPLPSSPRPQPQGEPKSEPLTPFDVITSFESLERLLLLLVALHSPALGHTPRSKLEAAACTQAGQGLPLPPPLLPSISSPQKKMGQPSRFEGRLPDLASCR